VNFVLFDFIELRQFKMKQIESLFK